jgi:hypothetical protein
MTKERKKPDPNPADVPSSGSGSQSALDALKRKRAPQPPVDLGESKLPAKGKRRA